MSDVQSLKSQLLDENVWCAQQVVFMAVARNCIKTVGITVAAAQVWNSLLEAVISSSSLQSFRRQLKTHRFQLSYPHLIL